MTQNNLGSTLSILVERETGAARLEDAVEAFRAALEVFECAGATFYVEQVDHNLIKAKKLLDGRRRRPDS